MLRFLLMMVLVAGPALAQTPGEAGPAARLDGLRGAELAQGFSCSPRKTCGQMRSCEEACFHLTVCGDTARDGDRDGIPCETLCGNRRCR